MRYRIGDLVVTNDIVGEIIGTVWDGKSFKYEIATENGRIIESEEKAIRYVPRGKRS